MWYCHCFSKYFSTFTINNFSVHDTVKKENCDYKKLNIKEIINLLAYSIIVYDKQFQGHFLK
jgi:hypothetical protein